MGIYTYEPQGIIKIYRYIPLDNTYQNTLHFRTPEEQYNYFHLNDDNLGGVVKLNFSGQTITRNERQVIRIDHNYADLMDCNYLAYLNKPFATPNPLSNVGIWVYAFITSVEYISPHCTEIEFEIDVMQTFMWNYELRECFVEREHSEYDEIGDSLTPEPTQANINYKTAKIDKPDYFNEYSLVMVTSFDPEDVSDIKDSANYQFGGLITGGVSRYDSAADLQQELRTLESMNLIDGIQAIYYLPSHFVDVYRLYDRDVGEDVFEFNKPVTINGYMPKNNKLFTYPYTMLTLDCYENQAIYKPEFFPKGDTISFRFYSSMQTLPQIMAVPEMYENQRNNIANSVVMTKFLPISYRYSQYRQWLAQTWSSMAAQSVINGAHLLSGAGGNMVGTVKGVSGFANEIENTITGYAQASITPPVSRGETAGGIEIASRKKNFYFIWTQLTEESAKIVDNFFTMFGYNTQKVKIPNIRYYDDCRPLFNYIKCGQMSFHWELHATEGKGTSVPQKYMRKIMQIYQNGITFWKDPYKVGRYNEPNAAKTRG